MFNSDEVYVVIIVKQNLMSCQANSLAINKDKIKSSRVDNLPRLLLSKFKGESKVRNSTLSSGHQRSKYPSNYAANSTDLYSKA